MEKFVEIKENENSNLLVFLKKSCNRNMNVRKRLGKNIFGFMNGK